MFRLRLLFRMFAAALLAACGAATPGPPTSTQLFQDDFSSDLGLWELFNEPGASSQIADGQLVITLTNPSVVAFSIAAINVTDFDLRVNSVFTSGGLTNSYGVIFRYTDSRNFYRLDLTGDGLWGVSRRYNDQWISLAELNPAAAIHSGLGAANNIRIVGRGKDFVFYANGTELGRLSDANLPVGRIGLFASTFDDPNAGANFDNLNIVKP